MPIWLRKFTFNTLDAFYKKEEEEYNKANNKGKMVTANTPISKPNVPDLSKIAPTYTSKVSRK